MKKIVVAGVTILLVCIVPLAGFSKPMQAYSQTAQNQNQNQTQVQPQAQDQVQTQTRTQIQTQLLDQTLTLTQTNPQSQEQSLDEELLNRYRYENYINDNKADFAQQKIMIDLKSLSSTEENAILIDGYEGYKGDVVTTNDRGSSTFKFNVIETGYYNLSFAYFPMPGKGIAITRKIQLDGKIPFDEARNISFNRIWQDTTTEVVKDERGNQIRPSQKEYPIWQETVVSDSIGRYQEPFLFLLTAGSHSITFEAVKEPMAMHSLAFTPVENIPSYKDNVNEYSIKKYENGKDPINYIQAEKTSLKSDSMLYPISDKTSPATEPSDAKNIVLNTIGGVKWQNNGQWMEWKFKTKSTGLYKISTKFKKNIINGALSYRALTIDGKVPFREASSIRFPYDTAWQGKTLGDDKGDWLFYLAEGEHTIRLSCVLGDIAGIVSTVDQSIQALSGVHKKMLMIMGPSPDPNRDYQFEKTSQDSLAILQEQVNVLKNVRNQYKSITGYAGEQVQLLESVIDQTQEMCDKPYKIVKLFSTFVNNISALGNWSIIAKQQPLELDYLCISKPDDKVKSPDAGFFESIAFGVSSFFYTFGNDYNSIGSDTADLTIWVGNGATGGRDQANVLDQLIKNYFTGNSNIKVKLQLVQMGSLLSASIAGKGPDIALTLSSVDAMNYAMRGAVLDLSNLDGFQEVQKRFHPSAITPLTFMGKTYGIPETQTFPMMFYRADILKEIGVDVPKTWKDVIVTLPKLQKKRLNFGLPNPISADYIGVGLPAYSMFLFQRGGSLYNPDFIASNLDSNDAIEAFIDWTQFYTQYTIPLQYDPVNRFRMGEIPIMIADYSMYNTLSVFAPELEGLWGFSSVPGTLKENGEIDRSVAGSVTASVVLKDCKDKAAAWEFIRWWSTAEVQTMFANEIESILGSAGRYAPANLEALYKIPWGARDFENLMSQWKWVKGIHEIPGSYMTGRYLDFAFKQIVIGQTLDTGAKYNDPGQVLIKSTTTINSEIRSKYKEFGFK